MENVIGVVDRIRALQARVQPTLPANGFQQALARATDGSNTTPSGRAQAVQSTSATTTGPGNVTLAQMLGRPVAPATTPASPARGGNPVAGRASAGELRLPVDAPVTSSFGPRTHPITGAKRLHAGIDLGAPTGTPIGAAAAGTVTFAGERGGYGNLVIVDHGNGTETRYAHQDTLGVRAGQVVEAGEPLGTVGSTGQSTGPHLHFEYRRNGEPVDPRPLLGL